MGGSKIPRFPWEIEGVGGRERVKKGQNDQNSIRAYMKLTKNFLEKKTIVA